jgi:poly [ADP-ribose] polymerase 6/8
MELRDSSERQFMATMSSPNVEARFNKIKEQYGSLYVWHGSGHDRWHPVLRNGLKNATRTKLEVNRHKDGGGTYLAKESGIGLRSVKEGINRHKEFALGTKPKVLWWTVPPVDTADGSKWGNVS